MFIAAKQFLLYLQNVKNRSPLTIRNYGFALQRFFELEKTNHPTSRHIKEFTEILKLQGLSIATINLQLHALKSFADFCQRYGYYFVPPENIEFGKEPEREAPFLSEAEVKDVLAAIEVVDLKSLRDKAILSLFYASGLRLAELTGLDIKDVDLEKRQISVLGKGSVHRLVFFGEDTHSLLTKYLKLRRDNFDALFVHSKGRIGNTSVEALVREAVKKAGIYRKVTCHTFRHTFATHLLQHGADLMAIKDLLGHKHLSSTAIYLHNSNERLKEIYNRLMPKPAVDNSGAGVGVNGDYLVDSFL